MLEHLLELREAVSVGHASHDLPVDGYMASEWKQAKKYASALKPLTETIAAAAGDKYLSLSLKVPMLHCIFEHLKCAAKEDSPEFARKLTKSLKTRFSEY